MKRKEPVINNLDESLFDDRELYYQCLFVADPQDTVIIKNTSIDECKFMVGMAKFLLDFTEKESCGKCIH